MHGAVALNVGCEQVVLLTVVQDLIFLIQLEAGGLQVGTVGFERIGFHIAVAQDHDAVIAVHAVEESTLRTIRDIGRVTFQLARLRQGQGHIGRILSGGDLIVQPAGSGNSSVVKPAGDDQLAIHHCDDPLVLFDMCQCLQRSNVIGTADQSLLGSGITEDLGGEFTSLFGGTKKHIDIGSGNLMAVVIGSLPTVHGNTAGRIPALFEDRAELPCTVLAEDHFSLFQQNLVIQIVSHDGLDFGGIAVDGNSLGNLKGFLHNSRACSHRSQHTQQKRCADQQHEPALLHQLSAKCQGNQAGQGQNRNAAIDQHSDIPGFGGHITGAGFRGRRLGGRNLSSRCLCGGRRGGGNLHNGHRQDITVLYRFSDGQIHSIRDQLTFHQVKSLGNNQLCTDVGDILRRVRHSQRNANIVSCHISILVAFQNSSQAVCSVGSCKRCGAEHENRQQEYQRQKKGQGAVLHVFSSFIFSRAD